MRRHCSVLATAGLVLGVCWGAAAQRRDLLRTGAAAEAAIAGRIEIEIDRRLTPVRRAGVTLIAPDGQARAWTTSDTDGRYRFDRLAAGTYRIRADKLGFVPISVDPTRPDDPPAPVTIQSGEQVTLNLRMQRGGALEGRFIDALGNPIPKLVVSADLLIGSPDRSADDRRSATTDDLGRFRLHTLAPGRYVLRGVPPPPASGGDLYYPGVADSSDAAVLTLASGQVLDHLDVTVPTAPISASVAEALAARERGTGRVTSSNPGARIAGRVTRSDTRQPLADATVQVLAEGGGKGVTAHTSTDGRFEFTGLSAGAYVLTATADGFVSLDGGMVNPGGAGIRIEVEARDRIEQADLALARSAAIEGYLLDEFGDPAPGVSVQVGQRMRVAGQPLFVPVFGDRGMVRTDDRGWFRSSGLAPGDYYVVTLGASFSGGGRPEAASPAAVVSDAAADGFLTTFFPGTDWPDAATPVRVTAGADTRDVTFRLLAAKLLNVSGVAIDAAGRPAAKAGVMLLQTYGGEVKTMAPASANAAADGSFYISRVPEGTYVLQGFGAGTFGSLPLTIPAMSPNATVDVTLLLRPRTTARGHISFEGEAARPRDPSSVTIRFLPTDFASGPVGGNRIASRIDEAWDFEIPNLAWRGVIRTTTPTGWSLKAVLLDGLDITDTPYDFQWADVSGLELVLTSRVGTVAGTVLDDGRPASNANVIVFADDPSQWLDQSRFIAAKRTSQRGSFSVEGLLPGRYLAVAVPPSSPSQLDSKALGALRPFATPIEVSERPGPFLTLTIQRR